MGIKYCCLLMYVFNDGDYFERYHTMENYYIYMCVHIYIYGIFDVL